MKCFLCGFILLTVVCRVGYAHHSNWIGGMGNGTPLPVRLSTVEDTGKRVHVPMPPINMEWTDIRTNTCEAPPKGVDENLWKLMQQIDAKGAKITDLKADFTQEKFTPLLKKPLESTGVILIKGSSALWKTLQPSPTVMRIDSKEAKLYFPEQKVVEVYAVDQQMGALAASPFPRLEITKKYFTFERIGAKDLSPQADESKTLALRMIPTDVELRKHLDQVSVLLEIATGLVLRAETIDADGDRTVMTFSNIKTNSGLKDSDVELDLPPGVKITHPLEGVGGAPPPSREKGK